MASNRPHTTYTPAHTHTHALYAPMHKHTIARSSPHLHTYRRRRRPVPWRRGLGGEGRSYARGSEGVSFVSPLIRKPHSEKKFPDITALASASKADKTLLCSVRESRRDVCKYVRVYLVLFFFSVVFFSTRQRGAAIHSQPDCIHATPLGML